jgi:hypothetical protein
MVAGAVDVLFQVSRKRDRSARLRRSLRPARIAPVDPFQKNPNCAADTGTAEPFWLTGQMNLPQALYVARHGRSSCHRTLIGAVTLYAA